MNTETASIGTISHATLKSEHLIPAFAAELKRLAPDHSLVAEAYEMMASWGEDDSEEYEAMIELSLALGDALNELAPEGCYFGSHPGNGSDFGFWESDDDF